MKTASVCGLRVSLACAIALLQPGGGQAHAAGAVEMQVERIVVLAIDEYNDAMVAGDPAAWFKYFTGTVRRQAPQSAQTGKQAFEEYYRGEFERYRARWNTKKMIIAGRSAAVEFEWDAVDKAASTPLKVDMVAVFELAPSGKFDSVNFYFDSAKLGRSAPGSAEAR